MLRTAGVAVAVVKVARVRRAVENFMGWKELGTYRVRGGERLLRG